MIGQRAAALRARPHIHDDGCYLLCLVHLAWELGPPERSITPADVIEIYDRSVAAGAMDRDCYVRHPDQILEIAGVPGVEYIGHAAPRALAGGECSIELWVLPTRRWEHFTHGIYDPWVRSITRRDGHLQSLRIFRPPRP